MSDQSLRIRRFLMAILNERERLGSVVIHRYAKSSSIARRCRPVALVRTFCFACRRSLLRVLRRRGGSKTRQQCHDGRVDA